MSKLILDTNAYSNFLRGDQKVYDEISRAHTIFISVIVLGELYHGFKGGSKEIENKLNLDRFLNKSSVTLLDATKTTAEYFSEIKYPLKSSGIPIPINDVWIAAQAMESGSKLITYDKHFRNIAGLRIWDHLG